MGWDISVGTATRLRVERSGDPIPVEGEILRTSLYRLWGPPSLLYNGYRVSFSGVKQTRRDVNHLSLSNAEVKESVELYICSLCGRSWFVIG
jgi:hypothetical protein